MGRQILRRIAEALGIIGALLLLGLGTLTSLERCTRGDFVDRYWYRQAVMRTMELEQEYGTIMLNYELTHDEFADDLIEWQKEWSDACDTVERRAVDIPDEYSTLHHHVMRYCSLRLELADRWTHLDDLLDDEYAEMFTVLGDELNKEAQFLNEEFESLGW